ncbi:hypothetical protein [Nocardioides sp. GXZ039]|uniref:hypothetical protein n=1 Tax=Nocardioides sp. GXZ039 TaxID=3136018 RepID=UPI0030F43F8B
MALLGLGVVVMDLGRRARRADRARVLSCYVAGSSLWVALGLGFVLVGLTVGRPTP